MTMTDKPAYTVRFRPQIDLDFDKNFTLIQLAPSFDDSLESEVWVTALNADVEVTDRNHEHVTVANKAYERADLAVAGVVLPVVQAAVARAARLLGVAHTLRETVFAPSSTYGSFPHPDEAAAAAGAALTSQLSTASDRGMVLALVEMFTECMDSEMADALSIVKRHAPGSWAAVGEVVVNYGKRASYDEMVAAAADEPRWHHEFVLADDMVNAGRLFQHRNMQVWLRDLLDYSFAGQTGEVTAFHDPGDHCWRITIDGTDRVLRFVCGLLNQHAEQSPGDTTPPAEAERLEATLAGPPIGAIPACPGCGAMSWKVDADITTRTAIRVGDFEKVYVDRCCGEASLGEVGHVSCMPCGWEPGAEHADLVVKVNDLAAAYITKPDGTWAVINDYREL